jgi:hypothetical protein
MYNSRIRIFITMLWIDKTGQDPFSPTTPVGVLVGSKSKLYRTPYAANLSKN